MVKMAYLATPDKIDAMKAELDVKVKEITDGIKITGKNFPMISKKSFICTMHLLVPAALNRTPEKNQTFSELHTEH